MTRASVWGESPSGVSSARRAKPCSRSCRIASCAIARCDRRRPATLSGHTGWSQFGAVRGHGHLSPMALYRLVCAFGQQSLVTVLMPCGLPLPTYVLADEKPSHCLRDRVYLPTIVSGRVIWHLGYTTEASATAFTESYQMFQCAALDQEPTY